MPKVNKSRTDTSHKEPATKADVSAVIEYMDKKFGELASRNELKIDVARLEFKIEDAQRENREHIDKKFGEFISHVDAVFQDVKTIREEQAAISHHVVEHGERLENHEKRIVRIEAHA